MPPSFGTRRQSNIRHSHPPGTKVTRSYTRDVGMTKLVTASITFSSASSQLQAANGTFGAGGSTFAVGDPIEVLGGAVLNNGATFQITAVDTVNGAFLTVDPAPVNEGPITATVRTP
jgi:hypothetical protein